MVLGRHRPARDHWDQSELVMEPQNLAGHTGNRTAKLKYPSLPDSVAMISLSSQPLTHLSVIKKFHSAQIFSIMWFTANISIAPRAPRCVNTQQGTVNCCLKAGKGQGLCHQEKYTWSHTLTL